MLNLVTFDITDQRLLEKSYDALCNKEQLEIVTDKAEKEKIFLQTFTNIKTPYNSHFSFQNLFKIKCGKGSFYIAQCLADFGYPTGGRGTQTFHHEYNFQIIGIANTQVNLGITYLRAETKIDKMISRFFNYDIDFDGCEKFNEKYYLVSNNKESIIKYFDKSFLSAIAKHSNILLTTNNNQMYISFDTDLQIDQARIVQDILSHFKYLAE